MKVSLQFVEGKTVLDMLFMSLLSEVEWKMQFSRPDLLQLLSYSFI